MKKDMWEFIAEEYASQILLGIILSPFLGYLVKILSSYFKKTELIIEENQLATPEEIAQTLIESEKLHEDEDLIITANSILVGSTFTYLFLSPKISSLLAETEETENTLTSFLLPRVVAISVICAIERTSRYYSRKRLRNFLDNIADHAITMTRKELKKYLSNPLGVIFKISLYSTAITIMALFIITRIKFFDLRMISDQNMISIQFSLAGIGTLMWHWHNERKKNSTIKNLVNLHQKLLEKEKKLVNYIKLEKSDNNLLTFTTVTTDMDLRIGDCPSHIWFRELAMLYKRRFSDNPVYINLEKQIIQLIPLNFALLESEEPLGFTNRLIDFSRRYKDCKNFVKKINDIFSDIFHVINVVQLIFHFENPEKTTFLIAMNLTSLNDQQRNYTKNIITEQWKIDLADDTDVTIGPIETIEQSIEKVFCDQLLKEFKFSDQKSDTQTTLNISHCNEIQYFLPTTQIFLKPKTRPKQELNSAPDTKPNTSAPVLKPISFGENRTYFPKSPSSLVKPIPDRLNAFGMLDLKLKKELEEKSTIAGFKWLTEKCNEKIDKPPHFAKTNERLWNGRILFFKISPPRPLPSNVPPEMRLVSTKCIKTIIREKTYSLYIVNEHFKKLHGRTTTQTGDKARRQRFSQTQIIK